MFEEFQWIFLCIYLGEGRGEGALVHVYVLEHIVIAFPTERIDGYLRNLEGMKCSRSLTSFVVFQPCPPRGGSRAGQNRSQGAPFFNELLLRKDTAINRMQSNDLEACGMKCCYIWFNSEVKFLTHFWRLFGLSHFALFKCNKYFYRFLCGKMFNLHLFCVISSF